MPALTPTDEQTAIIEFSRSSKRNLLVNAYAGAAKTSTLILIAEANKSLPILCLAFNKSIKTEMSERMPGNCECLTMNSIGYRTWRKRVPKCTIDSRKIGRLLTEAIGEFPLPEDRDHLSEHYVEIIKLIETLRQSGYVPNGMDVTGLVDDNIFDNIDTNLDPCEVDAIREVVKRSIREGLNGVLDFTDQIYLPVIFRCPFPNFPLTLVDEAQDLSPLRS